MTSPSVTVVTPTMRSDGDPTHQAARIAVDAQGCLNLTDAFGEQVATYAPGHWSSAHINRD